MVKYELPNMTSGIDETMVSIATEVNSFIPSLLLFVFLTILIGGSIKQKRRTGSADMPMWTVIASLTTLMISLLLTLREGMIGIEYLSIVVVITVFSGVWLFLSRNRNEV